MYKVSRQLISDRGAVTDKCQQLVSVDKKPTGVANDCLRNSFEAAKESSSYLIPVAGWLVFPYNKAQRTAECIQHWWCLNEQTGTYCDYTPHPSDYRERVEYVVDPALTVYAHDARDRISSMVGKCLLRRDNAWYTVHWNRNEQQIVEPIAELRTELLFSDLSA